MIAFLLIVAFAFGVFVGELLLMRELSGMVNSPETMAAWRAFRQAQQGREHGDGTP